MAGPEFTVEQYRRRQRLWDVLESRYVVHLVLFLAVFFIVSPLIWQLLTSFKTSQAVLDLTYLPVDPTLAAYERALIDRGFWRAVVNSVLIASASTVIVMILGTPAGYVFSRFRFPFDNAVFVFVLFTRLFPPIGLVTPYYRIVTTFGLLNTKTGIVIANVYLWLPLVIYIMRNFFITIPQALDEAARVDGCTKVQAFRYVVFPVVLPGFAAGTILTFLYSWREFLFAFTVSTDLNSMTIPVATFLFVGDAGIDWAAMAAAAIVAVIPSALVVIFFQRYIVVGLTGGLKG
ncbi:trehalose/maltose transport system permease protein MalG [Halolamina pelagica]|uniref:Trehalose/maltose transport system permease protein MalG n=1 Tax=Halolamina pelagica TaxID=699431 RepID=A0A0N8HZN5_9EURY|nr:carbohydrate ABC transporter permease [Halolamina pelagica]KPN30003.1 trehalose/maltose transport system permease protein MalG [Halolamina pelagica]